MFQKILVAVDESASAKHALDVAVELAQCSGGAIKLLNAVVVPISAPEAFIPDAAYVEETMLCRARDLVDLLAHQCAPSIQVETEVLEGQPADRIVEVAERWQADLVVVGDSSRGVISRFLLGSTADSVVRHAPCPVLVVRQKRPLATFNPKAAAKVEEQQAVGTT